MVEALKENNRNSRFLQKLLDTDGKTGIYGGRTGRV